MLRGTRFNREGGDLKSPFLAGKERELLESKKWPTCFSQSVDITKVQIDAFKPWINRRVTELMGVEDEIVVDYCISQLKFFGETDAKANTENAGDGGIGLNEKPYLDPKKLQINLTGFMAKNAKVFVKELWELLIAAQENEFGIPQEFIDEKKREIAEMEQAAKEADDTVKQMGSAATSNKESSAMEDAPDEEKPYRSVDSRKHSRDRRSDISRQRRRPARSSSRSTSRAWYKSRKYNNRKTRGRYESHRRDDKYRRRDKDRRRRSRRSSSGSRSSSSSSSSSRSSYDPDSDSRSRSRSLSRSNSYDRHKYSRRSGGKSSRGRRRYSSHRHSSSSLSSERSHRRRYKNKRRSISRTPAKRSRKHRSVSSSSSSSSSSIERSKKRYDDRKRNYRGSRDSYDRSKRRSPSSATSSSYDSRSTSSSYDKREDKDSRSRSS